MSVRHTVRQGECLTSLAARYGFPSPDALHDHPDNAGLKEARPGPHLLRPGDVVLVPEREPRAEPCATGREHRFRVRVPRRVLKVRVGDGAGGFLSGKRYELVVEGSTEPALAGTIPDGGLIEHELPASTERLRLRVWVHDDAVDADLVYPIGLGHLDPHDTLSGVRARLSNLGYGPLSGDHEPDDALREAVAAFQEREGLDVTGELDDATRARIEGSHKG